ncbi:hypothetical protein [Chryseobacterium sp. CFS15]|uniref:hypothetical protein n=1 Tax=Chryseobacterium sp. CFS15 TaxID=2986946 RepID=UPI002806B76E|nr:hypothetical protein [Chryseobacterium sp. CFS15]MDQ8141070.1 hypothetical protein [Chryseobacterium sp. CFS15]
MLKEKIIIVPQHLYFEETIEFINSFTNIRDERSYIFDFGKTIRIDPFSLLYVSSELEIFKKNNPSSLFHARNFSHLTYPAHMGFFKSFGLNFGKEPGEAKGSNTYSPIEVQYVNDIKELSMELMVNPGEVLENYAENLSNILTQNKDKNVTDVLRYSIREILRNIVEHSESDKFSFCAQYLPSKQKVNFAVLDRGIGIMQSLLNNPKITIQDDLDAIRWALKPGVSGKVYPGQKNKPKGEWANSGYGLFMTSNICKMGGSFFISTGKRGLLITETQERELDLETHGTAIYLDIDLNSIYELSKMLYDLGKQIPKNVFLTPSRSTMDKNKKSLKI